MRIINLNSHLSDAVEKELSGRIPNWKYYEKTILGIDENLVSEIQKHTNPIEDTQRFSETLYLQGRIPIKGIKSFSQLENNPHSRFHRQFKNTGELIRFISDLINTNSNIKYKIYRIYLNLQTIRPSWRLNAPHCDESIQDAISVLYYVNDSDGDTYFFNQSRYIDKVSPRKGSAVVFPSNMIHAGSTPIKHETRIVINIVFVPENYE